MMMGIVLVAFLTAWIGRFPSATTMISTFRRTSSAARSGYRSRSPSPYRYFDDDVLSFYVAKLAQSQPHCLGTAGVSSRIDRRYNTLSGGLSSAAVPRRIGCWPRKQSAEERSSCLTYHFMTLSARANTLGGMVRPICLAVLKLITSSNLVGCSSGRSAGFAPLRILST